MQAERPSSPNSDDYDAKDGPASQDDQVQLDSTPYSTPPSAASSDAFGSESPELNGAGEEFSPDLQRLRRDHYQQGYVDGITQGKPASVQGAFDSGYPLGAEFGLQIGRLIGILQGVRGQRLRLNKPDLEIVDAERRLRNELLDVQVLFGSEFWTAEEQTGNIVPKWMTKDTFHQASRAEVARKHPLVHKWLSIVEELQNSI